MRILYVHATYVPPPIKREEDRFYLLSRRLEGEILQPIWASTAAEMDVYFGPGSYPTRTCGRFRYHWFLGWQYTGLRRKLELLRFYISKGLEVHRERPIDCIVVYSHQLSAVMAAVLKFLTGSRLVVEIATSPENVHLVNRPKPSLGDRLKHFYSDLTLHIAVFAADRLHLLSPRQMAPYPLLRKVPASVFHEFVRVSAAQQDGAEVRSPYILFVGQPWYAKGVDLLVEAFLKLSKDYPEVRLKLLGHLPEHTADPRVAPCDRIEVLGALPNLRALETISGAAVLVLPSRCEGMGRVLIEAMAAGVPVIGADVGGIPHMIREGVNGFTFPTGKADALEARLRQVLGDPELAARLGSEGMRMAREEFNEGVWVDAFADMVEAAVGPG